MEYPASPGQRHWSPPVLTRLDRAQTRGRSLTGSIYPGEGTVVSKTALSTEADMTNGPGSAAGAS